MRAARSVVKPAGLLGVAAATAVMLLAIACSRPVQGESAPAAARDGEEEPLEVESVQEALRCLPSQKPICALVEDALGEVENAFPIVDVASAERRGDEVQATVLRHASLPSEGVFFEYRFSRRGSLLGRRCLYGAPRAGDWLQTIRKPDGYEGSRVVYYDRCSYRGPCGAEVGRRVSFAVDGAGRLSDPRELGAGQLREGAEGSDCFFIPQRVSLPSRPANLRSIKGWGHLSLGKGAVVPLQAGVDLQGREVLLGPGSTIEYEVAGLVLRLDSDLDRGLRLAFESDDRWEEAWAKVEGFAEGVALDWSPPYLSDRRRVVRLGEQGAELWCAGGWLDVVCSSACEGFRKAGASFRAGSTVFLFGPGAILGGTCGPTAGNGEPSEPSRGHHVR